MPINPVGPKLPPLPPQMPGFSTALRPKTAPGQWISGAKGRYQIVRLFAEGGMAQIFLVRDQQGREQLLKLMNDNLSYPPETRTGLHLRFCKEVDVMANVKSPHVVSVLDQDPQPLPVFYIMEKINGQDLTNVVLGEQEAARLRGEENYRFKPHVSLGVAIQALKGLIAVEESVLASAGRNPKLRNVTFAHRDIKPDNLLMELDGKTVKRLLVSDFGIVRLPGSELTGLLEFVGTPGFAAPEMVAKGSSTADRRSDIFALGAVLYWLFTGEELLSDAGQLVHFGWHPEEYIAPLAGNRPATVPVEMWATMLKALAPRPEGRFQSYQEMLNTLVPLYRAAISAKK